MSERESVVQRVHEVDFERKIATKNAYFSRGFDISRQRIAFYDRLILLAGGTLTLSFTAATSFQSKSTKASLAHVSYFDIQAILLGVSIAGALAFSWLTLSSLVHSNRMTTVDESIANRRFSSQMAADMLILWRDEPVSEADLTAHRKAVVWARFTNILATIFAVVSIFSFLTAYVFLFLFVHANLFRNQ